MTTFKDFLKGVTRITSDFDPDEGMTRIDRALTKARSMQRAKARQGKEKLNCLLSDLQDLNNGRDGYLYK